MPGLSHASRGRTSLWGLSQPSPLSAFCRDKGNSLIFRTRAHVLVACSSLSLSSRACANGAECERRARACHRWDANKNRHSWQGQLPVAPAPPFKAACFGAFVDSFSSGHRQARQRSAKRQMASFLYLQVLVGFNQHFHSGPNPLARRARHTVTPPGPCATHTCHSLPTRSLQLRIV